jgi:beta-fructofuranosidase
LGPFAIENAYLLAKEPLYAGRLVRNRQGQWMLMAFVSGDQGRPFSGLISDPMPLVWDGGRQRFDIAMAELVQ